MKKINYIRWFVCFVCLVFCLLIGLLVANVHAGPFLISDPQPEADVHRVNWASTWEDPVPANVDGSAYIDLELLAPGLYPSANIQAGNEWKLNGEGQEIYEWSAPAPFSLSKPVAPLSVADLDLVNVGM